MTMIRVAQEVNWEATPEKDGPRTYADMLVKETSTLHKVLSKYLAIQTVEVNHDILLRVSAETRDRASCQKCSPRSCTGSEKNTVRSNSGRTTRKSGVSYHDSSFRRDC